MLVVDVQKGHYSLHHLLLVSNYIFQTNYQDLVSVKHLQQATHSCDIDSMLHDIGFDVIIKILQVDNFWRFDFKHTVGMLQKQVGRLVLPTLLQSCERKVLPEPLGSLLEEKVRDRSLHWVSKTDYQFSFG